MHLVARGERAGLSRWLGQPGFVRRFRLNSTGEPALFVRLWRVQGALEPWGAYLKWLGRDGLSAREALLGAACARELGAPHQEVKGLAAYAAERENQLSPAERMSLWSVRRTRPASRSEQNQDRQQMGRLLKEAASWPVELHRVQDALAKQTEQGPTRATLESYREALRAGLPGTMQLTIGDAALRVAMVLKDGSAADEILALVGEEWGTHPDLVARAGYHRCAALAAKVARRRQEAVRHVRAAVAALSDARGTGHPEVWDLRREVAVLLAEGGQLEHALVEARAVHGWTLERHGADSGEAAATRKTCAQVLEKLGRHADALPLRQEAVDLLRVKKGVRESDLLEPRRALAACLAALGRHTEELAVRLRVLDTLKGDLQKGATHGHWALARTLMAARRAGDGTAFRALVDAWVHADPPAGLPADLHRLMEDVLA